MRSWVMCAAGVLLAAGCATAKPKGQLATVNGEPILAGDIPAEFSRRHAAMGKFMTGDEAMVRSYVDTVVNRRLMLQEAAAVGLDEEPQIVTAVRDYEESQVSGRLFDVEVREKAKPTDDEVKAFYEKVGPAYQVREIVVATREEADAISAELKKGGDFVALARARSKADSAKFGGQLPLFQYGLADEKTEAVLLALPEGGKSEPFEQDGRWRILWLEKVIQPDKKVELAAIETKVREIIEQRKGARLDRELRDGLRAKYAARVLWPDPTLAGVKAALEAKDGSPAAEWTGGQLSRLEFASRLDLAKVEQEPAEKQPARLAKLLDELLLQKVFYAEGVARGYAAQPDLKDAVRRYREQIVEAALFDKYVYRGLEVTDAEVKAEFDGHPDRYKTPEAREVSQILVSTLEAAQSAKAKLDAGVAFDQVAADFATDPAMAKGSKGTGWVELKTLPPGFEAVFSTAQGEVTPPIQSKVGFHVVKVLKVKPEQPLKFANVKGSIRDELLAKKRGERTKEWTDQLRAKAKISIDEKAIKRYIAEHPAPETTEAPPAPVSHGPEAGSGMPPGMGGMPGGMPPHQMPPPAPATPPSK